MVRDPIQLPLAAMDAVIVDLDGTMVDTLGDFVQALQRMLAELPEPFQSFVVEQALVERLVGKGSEHLIKSLLAHIDTAQVAIKNVALFEVAWQAYQRHYPDVNGHYSAVYPGVREALAQWQQAGLKLVCVTNKPTAFAQALLAEKQLAVYFSAVIGGDAVARKKPDPMPLLHACAQLQTVPARTLMVGDSSNDALAARAAGCPVILVSYGYNHGEPVDRVDADGVLDSLAQLHWV
jgi:phosphoglycolate phosphatase